MKINELQTLRRSNPRFDTIRVELEQDWIPNAWSSVDHARQYGYDIASPDLQKLFNKHKTAIVKSLLEFYKTGLGEPYLEKHIKRFLRLARKMKLTWPELDVIERSFKTEKQINEISQEEREDILYNDWDDFVHALKNNEAYTAIIELEKYLKLGGSKDKARKQVAAYEDWFKKSLNRTVEYLNIGFFEKTIKVLKLLGFDWPEMDIAYHKDTIIKEFLSRLRRGNNPGIDKVEALRKSGYNWPELDVIERSLKADKVLNISEMISGARLSQTYQKLIRSIKSKKYDQAESIVKDDLTSEKWSDIFFKLREKLPRQDLVPFLIHMKDQIVRLMLAYFKEGSRFEVRLMLATLNDLDLNWPELAIIARSLRAELGK